MPVGTGWQEGGKAVLARMQSLVADLGLQDSVIFTGFRTDVPQIYRDLDVSVQPSLNENLGGPGNPAAPHAAENLTAFPQSPTNTDHKTVVENKLKNKVKAGRWFRYEVRIAYSQDSMPRLMKRLGLLGPAFNATWQVQTGLTSAQAQYTYASRVTAEWQELDPASTNAAPVNLAPLETS